MFLESGRPETACGQSAIRKQYVAIRSNTEENEDCGSSRQGHFISAGAETVHTETRACVKRKCCYERDARATKARGAPESALRCCNTSSAPAPPPPLPHYVRASLSARAPGSAMVMGGWDGAGIMDGIGNGRGSKRERWMGWNGRAQLMHLPYRPNMLCPTMYLQSHPVFKRYLLRGKNFSVHSPSLSRPMYTDTCRPEVCSLTSDADLHGALLAVVQPCLELGDAGLRLRIGRRPVLFGKIVAAVLRDRPAATRRRFVHAASSTAITTSPSPSLRAAVVGRRRGWDARCARVATLVEYWARSGRRSWRRTTNVGIRVGRENAPYPSHVVRDLKRIQATRDSRWRTRRDAGQRCARRRLGLSRQKEGGGHRVWEREGREHSPRTRPLYGLLKI
ncbi:hypothetical protein DFH08DRAFT_817789 [Mycena albidolilacea]|uniref:Uncharacterized protein n=1 Tax=Mycena albidolilacea TaxID=1033008 RepID=A0AAD6ZHM3_9AGAR|nr:hypothetical protein DFH08DRAFT_817789 [Mycena albidolilacea]